MIEGPREEIFLREGMRPFTQPRHSWFFTARVEEQSTSARKGMKPVDIFGTAGETGNLHLGILGFDFSLADLTALRN